MPCKFTLSVVLQMQERSNQLLGKYRLVHRERQEDSLCSDCNRDLDKEKRQGQKVALLVHEQVYFW